MPIKEVFAQVHVTDGARAIDFYQHVIGANSLLKFGGTAPPAPMMDSVSHRSPTGGSL